MTYAEFVARITAYLVEDASEANFAVALPAIIEQAELRCYRDVDFVTTHATATIADPLVAGAYTITLPSDYVLGCEVRLRAIAPPPILFGPRITLMQRDETFLAAVNPAAGAYTTGIPPKYWCESPAGTVTVAPAADAAFSVQIIYRQRPAPLSATNTSTWLATHCPDLMFYAAMVAGSGYVKAFGQAGDNPQMALSWEGQYQTALAGVLREEGRRKGEGPFDSSRAPPPSSGTPQ